MSTPENDQSAIIPTADPMLAAVAVLEQFATLDHPTLDALLDATDPRELAAGLIDVAGFLASMVANATGADRPQVYQHVRSSIIGLIESGHFDTAAFALPS